MAKFSSQQLATTLTSLLAGGQQPDGLEVVVGDATGSKKWVVRIPDRLLNWLLDLRLLRHVPLAYLVPDPELLPPESIRFFHLDRTWTDRLVDGAMSAGNVGTVDMTFTAATLTALRGLLDEQLGLQKTTPISGMLIRSELVERWPDLIIEPAPIRQDVLSRSIMIVLFAGIPDAVHIREPDVGLRFGVEFDAQQKRYEAAGKPVTLHAHRVLDVAKIKQELPLPPPEPTRSREIALKLRQLPYRAVFKQSTDADRGSVVPTRLTTMKLRGRTLSIASALGVRMQGDK